MRRLNPALFMLGMLGSLGLLAAGAGAVAGGWGSAMLAGGFVLGVATLKAAAPLLRWADKPRPGPPTCRGCGYDLRASPERCPECGRRLDPIDALTVRYYLSLARRVDGGVRFRVRRRRGAPARG